MLPVSSIVMLKAKKMYKMLLSTTNIIVLITLSFSSILAFPLFDHYIVYSFFIEGRTFHRYFGVIEMIYLIRWIPAIITYSIYSVIVFLAVRSENKKIWSMSLGILASVFLFFMRKGGLTENADVIDHLYYYLDYLMPIFGSYLGTAAIIKVKKSITMRFTGSACTHASP